MLHFGVILNRDEEGEEQEEGNLLLLINRSAKNTAQPIGWCFLLGLNINFFILILTSLINLCIIEHVRIC